MTKDFYTAIKDRRTIYGIGKETTIPDEKLEEIIKHAVLHTPSAFNSQAARVALLLGESHNRLWDATKEILRRITPEQQFKASTEGKIDSFRNGYGTVLFFEDRSVTESLQKQFALYKDKFPVWAEHANGMLQFAVWNLLEIEGLGASLQHYDPLIDDEVRKLCGTPQSWRLTAQMPFGKPTAPPDKKSFQPVEQRFRVVR